MICEILLFSVQIANLQVCPLNGVKHIILIKSPTVRIAFDCLHLFAVKNCCCISLFNYL